MDRPYAPTLASIIAISVGIWLGAVLITLTNSVLDVSIGL